MKKYIEPIVDFAIYDRLMQEGTVSGQKPTTGTDDPNDMAPARKLYV